MLGNGAQNSGNIEPEKKQRIIYGRPACVRPALLLMTSWRRERDSNPRYGLSRTHAFQACTLNHSAISPVEEFLPSLAGAQRINQNGFSGNFSSSIAENFAHPYQ
jgi:hypothetical protein